MGRVAWDDSPSYTSPLLNIIHLWINDIHRWRCRGADNPAYAINIWLWAVVRCDNSCDARMIEDRPGVFLGAGTACGI
jgi:hypothetical protein